MSKELKIAIAGLLIILVTLVAYDYTRSRSPSPGGNGSMIVVAAFSNFITGHINNIKTLLSSKPQRQSRDENCSHKSGEADIASRADRYLASAREKFQKKDYDGVIEDGQVALEMLEGQNAPGTPEIRKLLAEAYFSTSQFEAALEQYAELKKLDPGNREIESRFAEIMNARDSSQRTIALENLKNGEKCLKSGEYLQGIDYLEKALDLFLKHNGSSHEIASCYALEAKCQMKLGYYPYADQCINEALKANPGEKSYTAIQKEIARLASAPPPASSGKTSNPVKYSSSSGYSSGGGSYSSAYYNSSGSTSNGVIYVVPYDTTSGSNKIAEQNQRIIEEYKRQQKEIQARNQQIIDSYIKNSTYSNQGSSNPGRPSYSNPYSSNPSSSNPSSSNPYSTGPSYSNPGSSSHSNPGAIPVPGRP